MDEFEDARHDGSGKRRRAFRKPTDELIEEFFGAYLEMKWISACLNEDVNECESEHGDMWISVIDEPDGQRRCLPRPAII